MRIRTALLGVAVVLTSMAVAPTAGAADLDWTMDPVEGPAGTTITISGVCVDNANEWEAVFIYLGDRIDDSPGPRAGGPGKDDEPEFLATATLAIVPGVPWSLEIVVPADVEPGKVKVAKQCARVDDDGEFDGGEATTRQTFTVTEVAEATTTTLQPEPEPTSTTTTTEPDGEVSPADVAAPAPAATPVAAAPTFTG